MKSSSLNKHQNRAFPIHPISTGFGFEIGSPENKALPYIMFKAQDFIIYTIGMTAEEVGTMMEQIMDAVTRRDVALLASYRFLGRLYTGYDNSRPPIPAEVRERVLSIGYCVKCGSTKKLEVDHIIPFSKGGAHDESNFQCLCKSCNCRKNNKLESAL
jgi:hypothetical protein